MGMVSSIALFKGHHLDKAHFMVVQFCDMEQDQ